MSKLAHSNTKTMLEIEMQSFGIKAMYPARARLSLPKCEAVLNPKWYLKEGATCSFIARYEMPHGKRFCNLHAQKWAVENG